MKDQPGSISIEVSGDDLSQLTQEAGNHRLQRVPPTERKGRVHTSSIVVAVLSGEQQFKPSELLERDLHVEWYSGTGCGGQARNKNMTSCRLTHVPSGITKTSQTRSRVSSYDSALRELKCDLDNMAVVEEGKARKSARQQRILPSSYVRSYNFQHGVVKSQSNQISITQFEKGFLHLMWE